VLARLERLDRRLIERLYWDGWTEAAVGTELGISQSAVSRRKSSILDSLRRWIGPRDPTAEIHLNGFSKIRSLNGRSRHSLL
jgi:DNA-directed RNA polymerase specialized sigma24 family protein